MQGGPGPHEDEPHGFASSALGSSIERTSSSARAASSSTDVDARQGLGVDQRFGPHCRFCDVFGSAGCAHHFASISDFRPLRSPSLRTATCFG